MKIASKVLALALLAMPASAGAQQAQEQIERTIGSLFIANTTLSAQVQSLQAELAAARARIKELETKADETKKE
jgi:predicted  nucleic acid-binding Zn-ribbon protein